MANELMLVKWRKKNFSHKNSKAEECGQGMWKSAFM